MAKRTSAELMAALSAGGEVCRDAIAELQGSVLEMSLAADGCRTVQQALDVGNREELAEIVSELCGHVRRLINSRHGNYVIQKVVEVMPLARCSFVIEELRGVGAATARHKFGCRVLCRLLEHYSNSESLEVLLDEVLAEAGTLARHPFASHVVKAALEFGQDEWRCRIVSAFLVDVPGFAQHRHGSRTMESALQHCSREHQCALVDGIVGVPGGAAALAKCRYGAFVVSALLKLPGEGTMEAWSQLSAVATQLRETRHGLQLLEDAGLPTAAAVAWPWSAYGA